MGESLISPSPVGGGEGRVTRSSVSAGGLTVLDELANSKLANKDDLILLNALNANTAVDAFELHYAQDVDETTFFADDEDNEDDEENGEGGEHDESGIEDSQHG